MPGVLAKLFHVYECEGCIVTFAVEQAFEDQSTICCPVCCQDDSLRDVTSGEMLIKNKTRALTRVKHLKNNLL